VTLPPTVLYPISLAALALGLAVGSRRRTGTLQTQRLPAAGLAVIVLSTAAFAVVALNRGSDGVFFAGRSPMLFGVLPSPRVLRGAAVTTGRRACGSVP